MNLRGSFDLERVGPPGEPLHSQWDVRLGLQQSNLQCGGMLLENVCGEVALAGRLRRPALAVPRRVGPRLAQLQGLSAYPGAGPIWIDDGRVLFGSWVDRRERRRGGESPARRSRRGRSRPSVRRHALRRRLGDAGGRARATP